MSKLDPLPPSSDEYWKEANVNKHELSKPAPCEHQFIRKSGTEVQCIKCPIGFIITPDIELKKGHLFKHGGLMI
jgi:hypothetical protein